MVRKAARFYLFVFLSSLLLVTLAQFTLAAEWVSISGNVVTGEGTPICAMVLANGQYMFSDQMDGSYDLQVPLDSNGFITLFAFADGFSPFKVILTPPEASNYEVEMAPAAPDTPEMFLSVDFGSAPSHPGWYRIRGKVTNDQETSLCAMVLANGQYMFSNQIDGSYSLEVPFDENGNITLFAFADGFKPYKQVLSYSSGNLPPFVYVDVLWDHVTYDPHYWTHEDVDRMVAASEVTVHPGYNPTMSPVYVKGGPIATNEKLYYFPNWSTISPNIFANAFTPPAYPPPGPDWEDQTYTFEFSEDSSTRSSTYHVYSGELRRISPPEVVSYDQVSRTVAWENPDENADVFVIRILPLNSNGYPDGMTLVWSSGHIENAHSFVLPSWISPGDYALRFESRDYREGSDQILLNRSIYYTKISIPASTQ